MRSTECPSSCYCVCVIGPPHLVTSRYVRRHLVKPGDRLRLSCPVKANPPALVTWYKDGGTIHLGWDRYRVRADDWTLSVRDVQLDDTGIFTCRATNGFGSIDITYLVYVSRKSAVTMCPRCHDYLRTLHLIMFSTLLS